MAGAPPHGILLLASGTLYWQDGGWTHSYRTDGTGGVVQAASDGDIPGASDFNLAVDATTLYQIASGSTTALDATLLTGGNSIRLATATDAGTAWGLAVDAAHVYWGHDRYNRATGAMSWAIERSDKTPGTSMPLVEDPALASSMLALDDTALYVVATGASSGAQADGLVVRIPKK
ncbi:MAG: hypothetical protein ACHQ53_15710 [Polyangiales bacterium]